MTVQLLQYTDRTLYEWDHAQDHRPWIGVWGTNRAGFSAIPYFIENPDSPQWRQNHQQAHNDSITGPPDPVDPFSSPIGQDLQLTGPSDTTEWWIWKNHHEHLLVAQDMIVNQHQLYYPFY